VAAVQCGVGLCSVGPPALDPQPNPRNKPKERTHCDRGEKHCQRAPTPHDEQLAGTLPIEASHDEHYQRKRGHNRRIVDQGESKAAGASKDV
jgi:hypothetical protein